VSGSGLSSPHSGPDHADKIDRLNISRHMDRGERGHHEIRIIRFLDLVHRLAF
jgi:hypothetical protein